MKGKCSNHYANPATSYSYILILFWRLHKAVRISLSRFTEKSATGFYSLPILKFSHWRLGDITTKGITSSDIRRPLVLASPSCKPRGFFFWNYLTWQNAKHHPRFKRLSLSTSKPILTLIPYEPTKKCEQPTGKNDQLIDWLAAWLLYLLQWLTKGLKHDPSFKTVFNPSTWI